MDAVQVGEDKYLVLYHHGSGFPVIRIAVYRQNQQQWDLVAQPPKPSFGEILLPTSAVDGRIFAVGERTMQRWLLYDAKAPGTGQTLPAGPGTPSGPASIETLKLPATPPTERFSQKVLTKPQLTACANFRAKAGTTRQMEWYQIARIAALPVDAFPMSPEDVISLLGVPARREQRDGKLELSYVLEQTQRGTTLVTITFREGYATMLWLSSTLS